MADDVDQGNEPEDLKNLRKLAEDGKQAKAELEAAKREIAFAKAGIDTDSKLGKMLFRTYEGDLTNDALKAEAEEIGLMQPSPKDDEPSDEDRARARRRADLASGSDPGDGGDNGKDPRVVAKEAFDAARNDGDPADIAAGAYLSTILQAAAGGDRRVIINPGT